MTALPSAASEVCVASFAFFGSKNLALLAPFLASFGLLLASFGAFGASFWVRFESLYHSKSFICNKSLASFPLFNISFLFSSLLFLIFVTPSPRPSAERSPYASTPRTQAL
jgi:uncharacterized membrane protein YcfT